MSILNGQFIKFHFLSTFLFLSFSAEATVHGQIDQFELTEIKERTIEKKTLESLKYSSAIKNQIDLELSEDMLKKWGGSYVVAGDAQHRFSENLNQCDGFHFEKSIMESEKGVSQTFEELYRNCRKTYHRRPYNSLGTLIVNTRLKYDFADSTRVFSLKLREDNGQVLNAHLVLKKDDQRRPMVVVRCGVHCDLGDTSLRKVVMILHDEAPFNLLLLPSITSKTYQKTNKVPSVGGFDEGRQNLIIAEFLLSERFPFSEQISSLHLLGLSLGGHASLYTSLYNSFAENSLFQSVTAACPVVNLNKALEDLFLRDGLMNQIFYNTFKKQVSSLKKDVPIMGDLIDENGGEAPSKSETPEFIIKGAHRYYSKLLKEESYLPEPLSESSMNSKEELKKLADFRLLYEQIKTPTILWAADDDSIVLSKNQSYQIREALKDRPNPFVETVRIEKGTHCHFDSHIGWRPMGASLRAFILKNSPERKAMVTEKEQTFPLHFDLKRFDVKAFYWEYRKDQNDYKLSTLLELKGCNIFDFQKPYFPSGNRIFKDRSYCEFVSEKIFQKEDLEFSINFPQPAKSVEESLARTRWLNAHAMVKTDDRKLKLTWLDNMY